MTALKFIEWFGILALVFAIIELLQRPARRKGGRLSYLILSAVMLIAAAGIAFLTMAYNWKPIWNMGYLPGALYAVLLCGAAANLVFLILAAVRRDGIKKRSMFLIRLSLTLVFCVYGTVNMQIIAPKKHTYVSRKLDSAYTFVFLADLHYGSAQSQRTVEKALAEIKEIGPDFVLLGGDITDEYTTAEEMRWIYQQIGALGVPAYFIYGNHDRQEHGDYIGGPKYTPEELAKEIKGNGITILRDSMEQWADDLVLLGREDYSADGARCSAKELPARPDGAYVVCVDHSPYQEEDILETGADLQLSGHVHAGQFFPLRQVYKLGVKRIYGEYQVGETDLYVSSGITGWYYPFRTEAHCNYEVVTLRPE